MQVDIDWKECIKDSPKFRSTLLEQEKDLELLETHLEKLVKQCDAIVESGRAFQMANNNFFTHLQSLMKNFKDDTLLLEAIGNFSSTLTSWHQMHFAMMENCNTHFSLAVNTFIKNDLKRVKDSRKHFQKMSDEVENAFGRNAQVSKSRVEECEEAGSNLTIARNNFKKSSLDYLFEINVIQTKKRTEILNCLLTYLFGHERFLAQNQTTFSDLKPYLTDLSLKLQNMKQDALDNRQSLRKELNLALDYATNPCLEESVCSTATNLHEANFVDTQLEGYLYKRTSNAFKSWVRRWFIVENNQLLYCSQHRSRDGAVVLERDLRLCNVMPFQDTERRFCFQIMSPLRTHLLQADNEKDCQLWVTTIQETARKAYSKMNSPVQMKSTSSNDLRAQSCSPNRSQSTKQVPPTNPSKVPSHIKSIFSIDGNNECCDCGHPDPRWASFNLGITLCIECSGIHRSFGVHKSKVKSVTLDAWEVDQVKVMELLGNSIVNQIFEANVDESIAFRATPNCSRDIREAWITAKYIKKSFVRSFTNSNCQSNNPSTFSCSHSSVESETLECQSESCGGAANDKIGISDDPLSCNNSDWLSAKVDGPIAASKLLCRAAAAGSLPGMLKAIALGADPNFRNSDDAGKTPLIYSLVKGQMAPVEFMLLHGAKVDVTDDNRQAPLHHAANNGNTGQVCLLLKRKANLNLKDSLGLEPLSIAIKKADANVVTILRLAKLNEEMRGEDMFAEFFKDFSAINTHDDGNDIVGGEIPLSESYNQSAINLPFSYTDK